MNIKKNYNYIFSTNLRSESTQNKIIMFKSIKINLIKILKIVLYIIKYLNINKNFIKELIQTPVHSHPFQKTVYFKNKIKK